MLDPEKDWVKKRNTRSAIGRRTVLVGNVIGQKKDRILGRENIHARQRILAYQLQDVTPVKDPRNCQTDGRSLATALTLTRRSFNHPETHIYQRRVYSFRIKASLQQEIENESPPHFLLDSRTLHLKSSKPCNVKNQFQTLS